MTPGFDEQFFALITPVAIITAVASGLAMGLVIRELRPAAEAHLTTFFALVLGLIWYAPQAVQLYVTEGTGFGTLGRWALYTLGFVVPMWLVLRWRR